MPRKRTQPSGSCPIFAKGKEHHSRANEEIVICFPWAAGGCCTNSQGKRAGKTIPRSHWEQNLFSVSDQWRQSCLAPD